MGVSWRLPRKNLAVSLAVFSLLLFLSLSSHLLSVFTEFPQICYTNVTLSCCPSYFSLKKKYIFSCFKQIWWSLKELILCHLLTKVSSRFLYSFISKVKSTHFCSSMNRNTLHSKLCIIFFYFPPSTHNLPKPRFYSYWNI